MKRLTIILLLVTTFGCEPEYIEVIKDEPEPEKEEMLCLFKRNPTQTDPSCIPNCPPYKTFYECIEKWKAYQYDGKSDWIIEENCDQC